MRLYSVYLPAELKRGLARLKARDGISESEALRQALAAFLKQRRISLGPAEKGGKRTARRPR
jgi:hypothetical protein